MRNENKTLVAPEGYKITFRERESVEIKLDIPKDVLENLEAIARKKNLSVESVLKFFIGQGLRNEIGLKSANEQALERIKSRKISEENTDVNLAA